VTPSLGLPECGFGIIDWRAGSRTRREVVPIYPGDIAGPFSYWRTLWAMTVIGFVELRGTTDQGGSSRGPRLSGEFAVANRYHRPGGESQRERRSHLAGLS
jgi:hypothetical protein